MRLDPPVLEKSTHHPRGLEATSALSRWQSSMLRPMGLMYHGIQRQHDAGNLIYPHPRGNAPKQVSPEHIVNGPMAPLVDGVTLGMVGEG